ncbi:uncharacterized protein [Aristolochia californica]
MKRRRGSRAGDKKGKKKKLTVVANHPASNFISSNTEDDLGSDYDDQLDTTLEADTPSHWHDKANNDTDCQGYRDKNVLQSGHGRVKVKLKSSKESQRTCSDTQTLSDTDKSSQQVATDRHGEVVEKKEMGSNLQPERPVIASGSSLRRLSTVKIKASGGLSSHVQDDRVHMPFDNENTDSHMKEPKLPHHNYQYNEKELNTALTVIKKIMKMEAAEPFNVPVNPVALRIPDYFDIIETPMDFGTICHNIEHGNKYRNSDDVYKDVQIIWDNCHRYNNKGDYILDLMKRVKKNFAKHWIAAGLHSDTTKRSNDATSDHDSGTLESLHHDDDHGRGNAFVEPFGRKTNTKKSELEIGGSPSLSGRPNGAGNIQMKGLASSSQEKPLPKGVYLKQKKRGRHGIDLHKSDCLCAVCVVRRRKRERFAQMVQNQITEKGDVKPSPEFKLEEMSTSRSPCSENVLRNLETPVDHDLETDTEDHGHEYKLETHQDSFLQEKQGMNENEGETQKDEWEDKPSGHVGQHSQGVDIKDEIPVCNEAAMCDLEEGAQKHEESSKQHNQAQIISSPLHYENPAILRLCGMLFPSDPKSGWSGPHSLIHHDLPAHDTPINSAIAMFMK